MFSIKTHHTLIVGDARQRILELKDKSVGLVITSPPYWNIKDYGVAGQIGCAQSYEDYIDSLKII